MTLYQEIEGSKRLYPAEQAIKSLRNVTELAADLPEVRIYRTRDGKWLYRSSNGDATPCVTATSDYQQIEGYAAEEETDGTAMRFLFRTAFECRFCYKKTVSLHAACIELDDFAVAFTGPSGVGKSTRALAWINALGAKLISGDRPAVRIEKTGSTACGVPWDGKEQVFRDVEKPLRCILEVRRSSSDYLRKLSREQAQKLIVQQSFVPMWRWQMSMRSSAGRRYTAFSAVRMKILPGQFMMF